MAINFPARIELNIDSVPIRFFVDYTICENPDCGCNGVNIMLSGMDKGISFFLDFSTESCRNNDYDENEVKIIAAFINFIKSKENDSLNLDFFKENYKYVKDMIKRRADAIESFELGTFLIYREIMWYEDDIKMNINGKDYGVFDGYCVTPDCCCKSVALNFFEYVHKLGVKEPDFSFVYDYVTGICREPIGISEVHVENIIRIIPESLKNKFEKRQAKLKKEVKKDIEKKIKEKGFIPKETGKRKLGRNEPCHCGSGRKYKKCCLDKDIGETGKPKKVPHYYG